MANSNTRVAIDWVTKALASVKPGGIVACPMFDGATKSDLQIIHKTFSGHKQVASIAVSKKFVVINCK